MTKTHDGTNEPDIQIGTFFRVEDGRIFFKTAPGRAIFICSEGPAEPLRVGGMGWARPPPVESIDLERVRAALRKANS